MMGLKKRCIAMAALLLAAAVIFCALATPVLTPGRTAYGCMWRQYVAEPADSVDVLFIGSSIAYCDIIPAMLYEETGVTSYVMAGPVLTMSESYYYIREATRTQSPKVIFVELSGMFFTQITEYDLTSIGYMPFGMNKLGAMASSLPVSGWIDILFPMHMYHSRWSTLTWADFKRAFTPASPDLLAGYTNLTEHTEFPTVEPKGEEYTDEQYASAAWYLKKIKDHCADSGIELAPYLSPRRNSLSGRSMSLLEGTLRELDLTLTDFDVWSEQMEIDPMTDYYDRSHLNRSGAEKFTAFLAGYLPGETGLGKSVIPDDAAALWDERIRCFNGK